MQEIIDFIKVLDLPQLTAIGIMFWFFKKHIEEKFDKRFDKMESEIAIVHRRIDIMHQRFDTMQQTLIDLVKERKI